MSEEASAPRGKVARLLHKYGIESYGDYLTERWTDVDPAERLSLRALAREFNVRLIEVSLESTDTQPVRGEAETYYESLTGETVSRGEQTQARRTLEQRGVDVAELESEFVSRQAISTYLTKEREVSQPDTQSSAAPSAARETIERLRERTTQVASSKITRLREAGAIVIGDFRVLVDVQVYCADCGVQLDVAELLSEGRCDCERTEPSTAD